MSPKQVTSLDLTNEVFKGPTEVVNKIAESIGLKHTKVIETFVLEERDLKIALQKQSGVFFRGTITWIGDNKTSSQGTIFCVESGSELKLINPNEENTKQVLLDMKRRIVNVLTEGKVNCNVCGKNIEIFDETASCPICNTKAHKDHLLEWVKMKHICPSCEQPLKITDSGEIISG